MEKGKLILASSPPSRKDKIVGVFFSLFSIFLITGVILMLILNPESTYAPQTMYLVSNIIVIIVGIFAFFAFPYYFWRTRFKIYENGITIPYSNFLNWLFHNNSGEGRFITYSQVLGYLTVQDFENMDYKKWKKKGKDGIFLVYWDDIKKKIKFALYGENLNDINNLKKMLEKAYVQKLPKICPNCGKKLYGMDYLAGECLKCHYKLFEIPPSKGEKTLNQREG